MLKKGILVFSRCFDIHAELKTGLFISIARTRFFNF